MKVWQALFVLFFAFAFEARGQDIRVSGQPAQLNIRPSGGHAIRVTLKSLSFKDSYPANPAIIEQLDTTSALVVRGLRELITMQVGELTVQVKPNPLTIVVTNGAGQKIQELVFEEDGILSFLLDGHPVLGMGEGGPKPGVGVAWRDLPVQFDRSGMLDSMQPRWQRDAYGSRNPATMLVGTGGWALFTVTPWVLVDLTRKDKGYFIPWRYNSIAAPQTEKNQQLNLGKGLPPSDQAVPDLFDLFVFDAHDPKALMKDFAAITGPAVLPPRWALGYMQSHRTLEDDRQMIDIVDTFRTKKIPIDAVLYLGTGFTPRGWNKMQPSFEFNPDVFRREPASVIADLHERNVKVALHIVPWDRDRLPALHGSIPARRGEVVDAGHIANYWKEHQPLISAGVDGFWPDEGDWFDLFERLKRHQLYYQGPISSRPDIRPWSLHRNGYPGIARWGGWVWSGDTDSSWKTLEVQIAVGINCSLSVSPFWGSDIGGFFPNEELTGELYLRWLQFGAFCPSFRAHGRTWWTRLPWGWGLHELGPLEGNHYPLLSELNHSSIEPIAKKYIELRYQLLPYNYTLAWEARTSGLPLMRALWVHYPNDAKAVSTGNEYMWGRDVLVSPVFEKGATRREVYLPSGDWYDWWTYERKGGGKTITRSVDLATLPIYVRAGAIIPVDGVRQYTGQPIDQPTTLKIFSGQDGNYTLYDDDGISQKYLQGDGTVIRMRWNDRARSITIEPGNDVGQSILRRFIIELIPGGKKKEVRYEGRRIEVVMD